MKLTYGKRRANGKMTVNVEHTFAKGWSIDDQASMVMRHFFKTYPDAEDFEWFSSIETGQICAFRCVLNDRSELALP